MINQINLQYVISQFGKDYSIGNSELGEIVYHCHICPTLGKRNNDRKLYVNVNKLTWYCQRCGSSGSFNREFTKEFKSNDIISDICNYLNNNDQDINDEEDISYYKISSTKLIDHKDSEGYKYIVGRGFEDSDIEKYDLRLGEIGKGFGYVIIPNKIISYNWTDYYTGRSYLGLEPRYCNPKMSNKSKILFNYHNIPDNPEFMILNEGPMNSIIAGDYSVASYGKCLSNYQFNLILKKNPKKLYISYDYDAINNAFKLCKKIKEYSNIKVFLVELPDGIDAVDLGKEKYHDLVFNTYEYKGRLVYFLDGVI